MTPSCPRCGPPMDRVPGSGGFRCGECAGQGVTVGMLRREVDADAVNRLWQAAVQAPPAGVRCPSCTHAMVALDAFGVELDICRTCQWVWLDAGERDALPAGAPAPEEPGEPELPEAAQEAMRRLRLHEDGRRQRARGDGFLLVDLIDAVSRWWP